MNLRALAASSGLLGGLCWVVRWVADLGGVTYVAGLVLLGLALAGVGAGLVSSSATWLRIIVAVAFPALVWSVYAVVRGEDEWVALDGVIGVVATALSVVGLVLARRQSRAAHGHRGGHRSR